MVAAKSAEAGRGTFSCIIRDIYNLASICANTRPEAIPKIGLVYVQRPLSTALGTLGCKSVGGVVFMPNDITAS